MHYIQEKLLQKINSADIWNLTLRSIGDLIGEKSAQKIKHHLSQLEKKGLIKIYRKDDRIKKIEKVEIGRLREQGSLIAIPIFGYADCGNAAAIASADARPEGFLRVSQKLLEKKKDIFALQAIGNSLNKAKIGKEKRSVEEGDFAIIDFSDKSPRDGDYILSIIDGCANLKKFVFDKENNQIVLISQSTQDHKPIFIHPDDDYLIGGKIIQVIKRPKIN